MRALQPVQNTTFSMTPSNFQEAQQYAQALADSQMIPKMYQKHPNDILAAMEMGNSLGLRPMQALQNIAVINGRPSIWGDAMLAIVKGGGQLEYIKESYEEKTQTAVCEVKRKGDDSITRNFSLKKAQTAGLWNKQGPWKQYPDRMLQMRARGFALRDAFPDALMGISIAEESQDLPLDSTAKELPVESKVEDRFSNAVITHAPVEEIEECEVVEPVQTAEVQQETEEESYTLEELKALIDANILQDTVLDEDDKVGHWLKANIDKLELLNEQQINKACEYLLEIMNNKKE